ncbi:MAG: hypothetical protein LBI17_00275 [Rickettsiales bacterium]|nr:hypothetical protein [Rickettsiales bacterium]
MQNTRALLAFCIVASVTAPALCAPTRRARVSSSISSAAASYSEDSYVEEDGCPKLDRTTAINEAIDEAVAAAVAEISAEEEKKRAALEADLKKSNERLGKLKAEVDMLEGDLKEAKAENAELMGNLKTFSEELVAAQELASKNAEPCSCRDIR